MPASLLRAALLVVACAPPLLPAQGGTVVYHDPGRAFAGLTSEVLVRGATSFRTFDMAGTTVQSRSIPANLGYFHVLAKPVPEGGLLALVQLWPWIAQRRVVVEFDAAGAVRRVLDPTVHGLVPHHDFQRLPNGNILLTTKIARGIPAIRLQPVFDDVFLEIDPAGNYVWGWSTADHYAQIPYTAAQRQFISSPQASSPFHTNAVQALPPNDLEVVDSRFAAGNLLISQRNTDLVFLLDKPTGRVVWTYDQAIGQHHASMIPRGLPGAGNVLLFDNGGQSSVTGQTRAWSQVVELDPVSRTPVWVYRCTSGNCSTSSSVVGPFHSAFQSSVQRLPNGNTLIDEAERGRVFEVDPAGAIVWEYLTQAGALYRSYRMPADWMSPTAAPFYW